jgi:ribosome-binding factor A
MESTRQKKISSLLQKDLGEIIDRLARDYFSGTLMSITEVRITPDLANSKIFISVFPMTKADEAMKFLKAQSGTIRGELGQKIRNQMRIVPELQFIRDETLDKRDTIDQLLKGKGDNPFK